MPLPKFATMWNFLARVSLFAQGILLIVIGVSIAYRFRSMIGGIFIVVGLVQLLFGIFGLDGTSRPRVIFSRVALFVLGLLFLIAAIHYATTLFSSGHPMISISFGIGSIVFSLIHVYASLFGSADRAVKLLALWLREA